MYNLQLFNSESNNLTIAAAAAAAAAEVRWIGR